MKYIVTTQKSFEDVVEAMHETVPKHQFGILHVHNIKQTLNSKGIPFNKEVSVFEVCNPKKAYGVLSEDMSINMALPCRISVWQEDDGIKIGTLKPTEMIGILNDSSSLEEIAQDVEKALLEIIDEVK